MIFNLTSTSQFVGLAAVLVFKAHYICSSHTSVSENGLSKVGDFASIADTSMHIGNASAAASTHQGIEGDAAKYFKAAVSDAQMRTHRGSATHADMEISVANRNLSPGLYDTESGVASVANSPSFFYGVTGSRTLPLGIVNEKGDIVPLSFASFKPLEETNTKLVDNLTDLYGEGFTSDSVIVKALEKNLKIGNSVPLRYDKRVDDHVHTATLFLHTPVVTDKHSESIRKKPHSAVERALGKSLLFKQKAFPLQFSNEEIDILKAGGAIPLTELMFPVPQEVLDAITKPAETFLSFSQEVAPIMLSLAPNFSFSRALAEKEKIAVENASGGKTSKDEQKINRQVQEAEGILKAVTAAVTTSEKKRKTAATPYLDVLTNVYDTVRDTYGAYHGIPPRYIPEYNRYRHPYYRANRPIYDNPYHEHHWHPTSPPYQNRHYHPYPYNRRGPYDHAHSRYPHREDTLTYWAQKPEQRHPHTSDRHAHRYDSRYPKSSYNSSKYSRRDDIDRYDMHWKPEPRGHYDPHLRPHGYGGQNPYRPRGSGSGNITTTKRVVTTTTSHNNSRKSRKDT